MLNSAGKGAGRGPEFVTGINDPDKGQKGSGSVEQVGHALEQQLAHGAALVAGKNVRAFRHAGAALVVDEKARALHRPEGDPREKAEHQPEQCFLAQQKGQPAARFQGHGGGKACLRRDAFRHHGMQGQIQRQNKNQTDLPRHHRRAEKGRDKDEHEEPRHAEKDRRQMTVEIQRLKQSGDVHARPGSVSVVRPEGGTLAAECEVRACPCRSCPD